MDVETGLTPRLASYRHAVEIRSRLNMLFKSMSSTNSRIIPPRSSRRSGSAWLLDRGTSFTVTFVNPYDIYHKGNAPEKQSKKGERTYTGGIYSG